MLDAPAKARWWRKQIRFETYSEYLIWKKSFEERPPPHKLWAEVNNLTYHAILES